MPGHRMDEVSMTVPYIGEARDAYVRRWTEHHLTLANLHYDLGHKRSTWLALLNYAMAEDIYGEHWDYVNKLKEKTNERLPKL